MHTIVAVLFRLILLQIRYSIDLPAYSIGPLAPRGAVGSRQDGLSRQLSLHTSQLCDMACVSANDLPVHSVMVSIHFFFDTPFIRLPLTVPCSFTLVRPADLVTCPCHFSFRCFTVAIIYSYGHNVLCDGLRTCSLVIRCL